MDDNVIAFPDRRIEEEPEEDAVYSFIYYGLIPWAEELGIDTTSQKFKLNAATIMTCLQGMVLDD